MQSSQPQRGYPHLKSPIKQRYKVLKARLLVKTNAKVAIGILWCRSVIAALMNRHRIMANFESGLYYIRMRRSIGLKHEDRVPTFVREPTSESDISEDISDFEPRGNSRQAFIDQLDREPLKSMRIEVNLGSERRENDFFIYEKRIAGGLKITEHCLIFSRRKLTRDEVKVEAVPLKLPNRLIYFEFECKF